MARCPSGAVKAIALAVGSALAALAHANPVGPQVVAGQVSMGRPDAAVLNIVNSPGAIINWHSFSIQAGETTRFIQQSANSAVLNRVTGGDVSAIFGQLLSNGRVFLINPNGIIFGKGAVVDTAGLVASSLNITDDDFSHGRYRFTGDGTSGAVTNYGSITSRGGAIYLLAPDVENHGLIEAPGGQIALAAGRSIIIGGPGLDDLQFEIQAPADKALNLGTLRADDGAVGMFAGTLQQSGVVQANAITRDAGGQIMLVATGQASVDGSVSATGPTGGTIEVLGSDVSIGAGARLDVSGARGGGTLLVGGDYQGKNPDIANATTTRVAAGAQLLADATDKGDGGKVVVWADQHTDYAGRISARGGANGGNGGQVEVSGKMGLGFRGQVDTRAPRGRTGNLLLDPYDIFVITGGGQVPSYGSSAGTLASNSLSIDPATLAGLNTDVTLAAGHDIEFLSALTLSNHALSATAGNNIDVRAPIDTGGGALTLTAHQSLNVDSTLNSGGGAMNLTADYSLNVYSSIDSGGGNLALTSTYGSIYLGDASVSTGGGALGVHANLGEIRGEGSIDTANGNITMQAATIDLSNSGPIDAGSGNVSLTATAGNVWVGYCLEDCGWSAILSTSGNLDVSASGSIAVVANSSLKVHSAVGGGDVYLETSAGTLTNNGTAATPISAGGWVELSAAGDVTPGKVAAGTEITVNSSNGNILALPAANLLDAPTRVSLSASNGSIGAAGAIRTKTAALDITSLYQFKVDNTGNPLSNLSISAREVGTVSGTSLVQASNISAFNIVETEAGTGDLLINALAASNIAVSVTRPYGSIRIADSGSPLAATINLTGSSSLALDASDSIRAESSTNLSINAANVWLAGSNIGFWGGMGWSAPIRTNVTDLAVVSGNFIIDNQSALESLSITTNPGFNVAGKHAVVGAPNLISCGGPCANTTTGAELALSSDGAIITLPNMNITSGMTGGFTLVATSGDISYGTFSGNHSATINGTGYTTLFPGPVALKAENGSVSGGDIAADGDVALTGRYGLAVTGSIVASGNFTTLVDYYTLPGGTQTITGDINAGGSVDIQDYDAAGGIATGNITAGSGINLYNPNGGDVTVTGDLSTAAGDVTLRADGNLTVTGTVTTTEGNVTANSGSDMSLNGATATGTMNLDAGGLLTSTGTLTAPTLVLSSGGDVALNVATSNLSLTATGGGFVIHNTGTLTDFSLTTNGTATGGGSAITSTGFGGTFVDNGGDLEVAVPQPGLNVSITTDTGGILLHNPMVAAIAVGGGNVSLASAAGIRQVTPGIAIDTTGPVHLTAAGGDVGTAGAPIYLSHATAVTAEAADKVFVRSPGTAITSLDITLTSLGTAGAFAVTDSTGTIAGFNRTAPGTLLMTGGGSASLNNLSVTAEQGSLTVTGGISLPGALSLAAYSGNLILAGAAGALTVSSGEQSFYSGSHLVFDGTNFAVDATATGTQSLYGSSGVTLLGGAGHAAATTSANQSVYASGSGVTLTGGANDGAYARLGAGTGQTVLTGSLTLTGGAAPTTSADAEILNGAGVQSIAATGLFSMTSTGNGAARTTNSGAGGQYVTAAGMFLTSPTAVAANADVIIRSAGNQSVAASSGITLSNNHSDAAGVVAIDAAGNQTIQAASLVVQTGSASGGTAKVSAGGNQDIRLTGKLGAGPYVGSSLAIFAGGPGSTASVVSTGAQTVAVTPLGNWGNFLIGGDGSGEGSALLQGGSGQRLVSSALTVQAGQVDGANSDVDSSGAQAISTLLGGIKVNGSEYAMTTGNHAAIDPTTAQSILSNGTIDVTGGYGTLSTAYIASAGTQVIATTLGNVNVIGNDSAAAITAAGNQSVFSFGAVNVAASANGATGLIQSGGTQLIEAGSNVNIVAGSGAAAWAAIIGATSTVTAAGDILLDASANGASSYAYIQSTTGPATLNAGGTLELLGGTGTNNADAFVTAGGGTGNVFVTAGSCIGCVTLATDPTLDPASNFGIFGLLVYGSGPGGPTSSITSTTTSLDAPNALEDLLAMLDYVRLPDEGQNPDDSTRKLPLCE